MLGFFFTVIVLWYFVGSIVTELCFTNCIKVRFLCCGTLLKHSYSDVVQLLCCGTVTVLWFSYFVKCSVTVLR